MRSLEQLLDSINPTVVYEETAARADAALNAFRIERAVILEWADFKDVMSRFIAQLDSMVLRLPESQTAGGERDWSQACRVMMTLYGGAGEKAAFEMARTGNEGGLYRVLRDVARQASEEYAHNEIRARIHRFRNECSADEWIMAVEDYLACYGHLLPSELTQGSAVRVKMKFAEVLEEHARLIRKVKQINF